MACPALLEPLPASLPRQVLSRRLARRGRLRIGLWLGLFALVLSTAACSLRKVAYGMAHRLIVSRVTDTFHLDDKQRQLLSAKVSGLHAWHRQEELPRYVALLDAFLPKLENGLDKGELEWLVREGNSAIERLASRAAPELAGVLDSMTPQQVNQSAAEMKKSERERFEKLEASEEDYVRHRLKAGRKNLSTWLGTYTPQQLAEYERFVRKNRPEELRRRKRTQQNQQVLLDALRSHRGVPALTHILSRWMTRQEAEETSEFQAAEGRNMNDYLEFLLTMDRSLSPAQRTHLANELRAWRRDLDELAHNR
jgi:hypothetical protein